ncbi:MAG: hypothetical protein FJX99_06825 [Bacteroidetes bacterium]|jgi:hypothetical protein|nr:hypothetical protein [Bacteroidota bacterium]NBU45976.1 hypothetical protein [Flavobacteriales bacterium]
MKYKVLVLFCALMIVGQKLYAQGCSQCKLLAEQGSEADEHTFGTNINTGILYLMVIPYLILMFLFRKQIYRFFKQLFKSGN